MKVECAALLGHRTIQQWYIHMKYQAHGLLLWSIVEIYGPDKVAIKFLRYVVYNKSNSHTAILYAHED